MRARLTILFTATLLLSAWRIVLPGSAAAQYPEQRITFAQADELRPHWNPNSNDIAFLINDDNLSDANCCLTYRDNIGMVNADFPGSEFIVAISGAGPMGFATTLSWIGTTNKLAIDEGVNTREVLEFDPYGGSLPASRYLYDGSEPGFVVKLTTDYSDYGTLLELSRDGSEVLWGVAPGTYSYGQNQLFSAPYASLLNSNGYSSGSLEFEDLSGPSGTYIDAAMFPDGTHFALSIPSAGSGKDIWIYPIGGSIAQITDPPIQVTHDGQLGVSNMDPEISPDGLKMAFARDDGSGFSDIYVVSEGTPAIQITNTSGVSEHHPTWSPDGKKLAFTRFDNANSGNLIDPEGPNANIYTVDLPTEAWGNVGPKGGDPSKQEVVYDPLAPIVDPPFVEEQEIPSKPGQTWVVVKMPKYVFESSSSLKLEARTKGAKPHKIIYEVQIEDQNGDSESYRKTRYSKQNEVRFRNVPAGTYNVRYQVHEVIKRKRKRSKASSTLTKSYKVVSNTGYSPDAVYVRAKN